MRRSSPFALALLALAAAVPAAHAADTKPPATALPAPRVRVVLNGIGAFTNPSFSDSRQYPSYAETASVNTSYSTKTGFGPDLALQVSLYRGLGLLVGYSYVSRNEDGTYDARLPHPLYLNQPRSLSGELTGYKYKEGAVHADVAYAGTSGKLDWSLFAGVSFFQVEADMLDQLVLKDEYPYDSPTVTSTPVIGVKTKPTGFNVGGRLDWRFGKTFGAGVLVRYSTASAKLRANENATEASFDAGGLQAGAGLRLYF